MESLYEFLEIYDLYVVLLIVFIIWVGLFIYLFAQDKKISKLENLIKKSDND